MQASEDKGTNRELTRLLEDEVNWNMEPLACERKAVWGIVYVNDEEIASKSVGGLSTWQESL